MKIKKSPLELVEFVVLNSSYQVMMPDVGENPNMAEEIASYDIDVDFVKHDDDKNGISDLFMKININKEAPYKAGYSIFVEGVAAFKFNPESNLTLQEKNSYLANSGISILINLLRSYLSNITSYGPAGKYVMPSIDVADLLLKKATQNEQHKNEINKDKKNK